MKKLAFLLLLLPATALAQPDTKPPTVSCSPATHGDEANPDPSKILDCVITTDSAGMACAWAMMSAGEELKKRYPDKSVRLRCAVAPRVNQPAH